MRQGIWLLAAVIVAALMAAPVLAAPSLDIQKPPAGPVPSNTGPMQDPDAVRGQWFLNEDANEESVCGHEFYDNVRQSPDKGGSAGHYAIVGYVSNITYDPRTQNIIAFDIIATITNDVPDKEDWMPGDNSHGEWLQTNEQYVGPLLQTKLTADFAVPQWALGLLPGTIGPYRDVWPHIIAVNYELLAWYCWTPYNDDSDKMPWGNYYVPSWDFGDIPQGQSSTRTLMFAVEDPGLEPTDPRFQAIEESYYRELDILLNRTTSLKISTWQDDPTIDYGIPYPHLDGAMPLRSSDCSVFHNVEHEPEMIEGGLSLEIRKPPVQPLNSWTGPWQDVDAVRGQWFLRPDGTEEVRSHEYYDPTWPVVLPTKSAAKKAGKKPAKAAIAAPPKVAAKGVGSAIYGVVTNVRYMAGSTNIAGFDIDATITNLTPWPYPWEDGSNSHDEFLSTDEQYEGTLYQTKLTAEFAVDTLFGLGGLPPAGFYPPYRDTDPHICAQNHDQVAWYCWTPDNLMDLIPFGNYYVPTWDFGDIPQGTSATRTLNFTVDGNGLPSTDLRYSVILDSQQNGTDVLANRSTSLKISTWIDDIYKDDSTTYPHLVDPGLPLRSSDCSVFHNIEEEPPPEVGGLSLPVTKPPVVEMYPWTGPQREPASVMGQWFRDLETGVEDHRTNEFYDPSYEWSLGVFIGSQAIYGRAINVQYDAQGNIVAFDIDATITNLTPWPFDWADGSNSHSESLSTRDQHEGTLFDTKLTAEFAVQMGGPVPIHYGAYRNAWPDIIEAVNHDQLGWYCWTPVIPGDGLIPWGDYSVPTWDFGDIPQGGAANRLLKFIVRGLINPGDPRYTVIQDSELRGTDILANRTTSLKISTWIDDLATDTGAPYPHTVEEVPLRSSDCSVFHNTEPRIDIATTLDWDWVWPNRPIGSGWIHKSVLTIAVVNDPFGNLTYVVSVTPGPASTGQVHIVPTANPLVWDIYGGPYDSAAQGMVYLDVQVNGVEFGGIGVDMTPLKVRVLCDIDDNGGTEPSDMSKLIARLNGMPVPGYPDPRSYDYDGNGGVEPTDMSTMINVLNGVSMP